MPDNGQERTEEATSRRREKAAEEGQFVQSRELSSFVMVIGGLAVIYFSGAWMASGMARLLKGAFMPFNGELTVKTVSGLFGKIIFDFILIAFPAFCIPLLGALAYALQSGFSFRGKGIAADFSRINPVEGAKRLFSLNSVVDLVKSLLKLLALGYVVYINVRKEWAVMPLLVDMDAYTNLKYTAELAFTIMLKSSWVLAVVAALDYFYQWRVFEKGLMMTRDEVREEMKETEGDPMIRARIRSIQRAMARRRMMQDVKKADFVVTNPTHLAVALKYERKKTGAPKVVAKGAGILAEKIKETARRHGVPVIENKPLAQALYKAVEIGSEIPAALYRAVAEILAYVYRLGGRFRGRGEGEGRWL
ncbi:MAG: flagellar biosynthesis protein FlhB [Deltaproteobacteria bacterium]